MQSFMEMLEPIKCFLQTDTFCAHGSCFFACSFENKNWYLLAGSWHPHPADFFANRAWNPIVLFRLT